MNFVEAISSCFRNYANFSGRAVRSEYWYWYLFVAIVVIVFASERVQWTTVARTRMLKKARRWTSAGWQLCSLLDSFLQRSPSLR
jgi:uncharacterized membrane protein YhaH (DUF805 family)